MKISKLLFIAAVFGQLILFVAQRLGLALSDTADVLMHVVFWLLWGASIFIKDKKQD